QMGQTFSLDIGITDCTWLPVVSSSEPLNFRRSGATFRLLIKYKLPVNFAGARGRTGALYCGLPFTCSCQFDCASVALVGCLAGARRWHSRVRAVLCSASPQWLCA